MSQTARRLEIAVRRPVVDAGVACAPRRGGRTEQGCRLELTQAEREHLLQSFTALTPRECEVACAALAGGANEAVADRLCIALPTLRTHLMRINQKLGTTSKSDLVLLASRKLLDGYRKRQIRGAEAFGASTSLNADLASGGASLRPVKASHPGRRL